MVLQGKPEVLHLFSNTKWLSINVMHLTWKLEKEQKNECKESV